MGGWFSRWARRRSSETPIDRRAALARLGLGAAAVYAAPALFRLSEARASVGSGGGTEPNPAGGTAANSPVSASGPKVEPGA